MKSFSSKKNNGRRLKLAVGVKSRTIMPKDRGLQPKTYLKIF